MPIQSASTPNQTSLEQQDQSNVGRFKPKTTIVLSSMLSVIALAMAVLILYWKRRYLIAIIIRSRKASILRQRVSPNLQATAWDTLSLPAACVSKDMEKKGMMNEPPRSDVAGYQDEPSSASAQIRIREMINIPSVGALGTLIPHSHLSSTMLINLDVSALRHDNDATNKQLLPIQMETDPRETEGPVIDPVLSELRRIRSQMALLQMRVDEIQEHDPGNTENLPLYHQVISRRGID